MCPTSHILSYVNFKWKNSWIFCSTLINTQYRSALVNTRLSLLFNIGHSTFFNIGQHWTCRLKQLTCFSEGWDKHFPNLHQNCFIQSVVTFPLFQLCYDNLTAVAWQIHERWIVQDCRSVVLHESLCSQYTVKFIIMYCTLF